MSFYRSFVTAIAALGLATSVLAADENSNTMQNSANDNSAQPVLQTADASSAANQAAPQQNQATDQKVDLNKATARELMRIKGLSAGKAKAIVAYRKKHGDFKSLDDLKDVKGFKKMNEETMKGIQEHLTVG